MALSSYNNYVTDLLKAGNDAFSNLYEVKFTLPTSSSSEETASADYGRVFTMRCKGFNHPEATAADPNGNIVYKVENGDGCGMFCIWFLIIDAFIILLYWIISGGH